MTMTILKAATAVALLGVIAALALPAAAATDASTQGCPPEKLVSAPYPASAARAGVSGTVTLRFKVDACGRVAEAEVVSGVDRRLDAAALDALRQQVMGPPSPEWKSQPVDGWYETQSVFSLGGPPTSRDMGWPRTHKRARYVLEASSPEFPTVAAVEAVTGTNERSYTPPFSGMFGRFVATGSAEQPEFWLLPVLDGRRSLAVRYRPVMEDGQPVVRMLLVCERTPEMCIKDQAFLMRGLPFAKAKK